ncbi:MAG: flavodoxin domain-containing protein [Alphaproteobacteria bacterium]|nr:flavodoxin domain-containing protein [Alphaproteobacteria bacterium]
MAEILILVGTESGNAAMVADCLKDELAPLGHEVRVLEDGREAAERLTGTGIVLICTSTHGSGELPDNIIPLHEALSGARPDLSGLRYGVIALGDQTYRDTFCNAGRTLDALFAELGAQRVGERLEIDACTQPLPDEEALAWAKDWVTLL